MVPLFHSTLKEESMTDRPILFDRSANDRPKASILDDLSDLDGKLLYMLAKRCRLVQRAAKGKQVLDREVEKKLWTSFEQAARTHGLDQRLARQLFALLGSFGLEIPEGRRSADKPFVMVPRSEPADIDAAGPRSLALTRMLAVIAAASGQALRLSGVVLNDPLIELIKALNQTGARLSWTEDGIECKAAPDAKPATKLGQIAAEGEEPLLAFEEALIFCGDDAFTLYALMALALREPGRAKFAGGAELKMLDLRRLEAPLLHLGARLAGMNPRSRGVPVRLESGGRMASRIELLPDTPPLFAQALALAAWSYPTGLRLAPASSGLGEAQARALDEALEALNLCQVKARKQGAEFIVPAGRPKVPSAPDLGLDPVLCAYLLALPALAGGNCRLTGRLSLPAEVQEDLKALGLGLEIDEDQAVLRHAQLAPAALNMGRRAEFLPLALALAAKAASSGSAVSLALPEAGEGGRGTVALEILDRLGLSYAETEAGLDVQALEAGKRPAWDGVWTSPDAHTTLGLALLSFLAPGVAIDNPGGLTALWPRFWACYNALPLVRDLKPAPKEPEKDDKPKRRRVRV